MKVDCDKSEMHSVNPKAINEKTKLRHISNKELQR